MDEERGTRGNRLFYLATQPSAFAEIVAQLGRVGLDHERHDGGWRRVVIEKPFGRDLDSAIRLNREVGKVFRERQVYRIDHYLGKETVRNLLVFRFGNGIFEPIWNRRHIDHVQITVAESIGIESRGAFYEETGASRDFLQNHLLQLLSLVAMEPPATFEADALRDEKVKVIRAVGRLTPEQARRDVVRGQYGPGWVSAKPVPGYRAEPAVDPASETETFIAARLTIDDWRWSGVPFYLRMGKRLPKRATEIAIQFKEVPHQLFRDSATDPEPNLLAMRIQPDEGIMLRFGAKVPGLGIDVRNVTMDFTYGSAFQTDSPDAYETLILDALLGDASLFTRADEVEEAWSIVDPIIDAWAERGGARLPELRGGHLGPRGGRGPARPRGPTVAADLGRPAGGEDPAPPGRRSPARSSPSGRGRAATGGSSRSRRPRPGEPMLRWLSHATHDRRHREGAGPDLGPARPGGRRRRRAARPPGRGAHQRDEPGGGRPAARGGRARGRDDQPADRPPPEPDDDRAVRGPGRPALAGRADPGPLRAAAGGRAGDLLRADLPDRRRRDRAPPDRARRAAAHPRPAGDDLVARGAVAGLGADGRRAGASRTAWWWTARAGRATAWRASASSRASTISTARIAIRDFALVRQSRWREAIATVFDLPDFLPYLAHVRRIAVTYATHDETGAPGTTNVVKPLYHAAWLASRLGMRVVTPLAPVGAKGRGGAPGGRLRPGEKAPLHRGPGGTPPRARSADVGVVIRPVASPMPAGTTLRVELLAERRGSELRADVTAEAENVHVHTWLDGVEALDRTFKAPRRTRGGPPRRGPRGRRPRPGRRRDDPHGGTARGTARPGSRSPRRRPDGRRTPVQIPTDRRGAPRP